MDILVIIIVAATIIVGFFIFGPSRETAKPSDEMSISQELALLNPKTPPSRQSESPDLSKLSADVLSQASEAPAPRQDPFEGSKVIKEIPVSVREAAMNAENATDVSDVREMLENVHKEPDVVKATAPIKRTSSEKRKDYVKEATARMEKARAEIEKQTEAEKDEHWHV